ncbi:MAG: penicillin-binding protein 2 [Tepidisphaeraceae bacterium]
MGQFSLWRAAIVMGLVALLLCGMTVRVAYLQSFAPPKAVIWAERQQYEARPLQARRGNIYDRNGVLMAGTVQTMSVYIDPHFMYEQYQKAPRNLNQMDQDLAKLAKLLDVKADELIAALGERYDCRYAKVIKNQGEKTTQEVLKLKIPGVALEPMFVRFYPMGSVASHILGSCGGEGDGLEGVELKFQNELAGRAGYKRVEKDARRRPIDIQEDDYVAPKHGQHMVLTIDANIQTIAEEELIEACQHFKAQRGEVVVLDPYTGEVLAMANYPTFNPQNVGDSKPESRRNACIMMPYEPGSTAKPFIAGPALATGVTRWGEVWPINSISYNPYGSRTVKDVHHYGPLCTWDILVKSSNIGSCLIAERMGNTRVHAGLAGFGFGQRSGIELPGEDPGLLWPLKKWTHFSTESVAQGYEFMVTPLQLARAFAVYGNDGRLVPPSIVKGTLDADGNVIARKAPVRLADCPRAITEDGVAMMRRILADVPVRGTAARKGSRFWNIYGKTGTSHVSKGRSGYSGNLFNSSFIAGAPYEKPRIVVAMVIHEPDPSLGHYGGTVSAPAAVRVVERTLGYLQEPPSPALPLPPADVAGHLINYSPEAYTKLTERVDD